MTVGYSDSTLLGLARRQLADLDALRPGSVFAEGVRLSVDEGYEVQAAVSRLRAERGERVVGYKVGCTSPKIRKQLGIDHNVFGRLYDTERHASGAEFPVDGFANLAIEGELAITLVRAPTAEDFSRGGLPDCVDRVLPVIELHHHVMRGDPPTAGELIAHNAIHAGFVTGDGTPQQDPPGDASLEILLDDRVVERCEGPQLVETIRTSLRWLAELLAERGTPLEAGQVVLTGSIPPLIPVAGGRVRVQTSHFGAVEARFTA